MSDQNFFTQATNFIGSVSSGVDARTGLYQAHIEFGHLVGNDNLGPSLTLGLSYSPLTGSDLGFGAGFSLGVSTYDRAARTLTLAIATSARSSWWRARPAGGRAALERRAAAVVDVAFDCRPRYPRVDIARFG